MKNKEQFGFNVAEIRKRNCISQSQLALMSGLSRTYVGEIERGLRNPSFGVILKLARSLDADPIDFFEGIS